MEEIAMTVSPTLQKYLDQSVTYDLIPHAPTLSSTRTAEACHVPGEALAKAVVLRRDGGYMMAVLPASRHLHLSALKSQLGHHVDLASEKEIAELFVDCDIGAIPPLGECYGAGRHRRRQHRCATGHLHGRRRSRHADPHEGRAIRAADGEGLARPLQHARLKPLDPSTARVDFDAGRCSFARGRRFSDGPQRSSRTRTSNRRARTG
jgi:hypothetical protein